MAEEPRAGGDCRLNVAFDPLGGTIARDMQTELDVSALISVERAAAIVDAVAVTPRITTVPLSRAAGRVLAEPVAADRDYPPFDKALMDGYAVRASDIASIPARLRVAGEIAAGGKLERAVVAGEALAIMTGAPLPVGADCVVPVEHTSREADDVVINQPSPAGHAITRQATDSTAGSPVLRPGRRLGPAQLAVAATVGATRLGVFHPPSAYVLATGDEIVPIRNRPAPHKIRNANNIMLSTLIGRLGADVTGDTHCPDDPKQIASAISRAAASDLLLVSGGMSMGRYDYVPAVLTELGYELRVTKVRIRPGKPFVFGVHPDGRFVFGLPGNPVSAFACTLRLVSRLIRRMIGLPAENWWSHRQLGCDVGANGPREFYQPSTLTDDGAVTPLLWKGSGDVFTLGAACCLLVRPEGDGPRRAGEIVRTLEIPT